MLFRIEGLLIFDTLITKLICLALQYEQSFDSRRLQNWELRNKHRRRPLTKSGFTQIISNDRGHLLPSQPRSARSPWGTFVGTWDLPKKLPGNNLNVKINFIALFQ